jgi:hypothetical protein
MITATFAQIGVGTSRQSSDTRTLPCAIGKCCDFHQYCQGFRQIKDPKAAGAEVRYRSERGQTPLEPRMRGMPAVSGARGCVDLLKISLGKGPSVRRRKATLARKFAALTFDPLDRVAIVALKGSRPRMSNRARYVESRKHEC